MLPVKTKAALLLAWTGKGEPLVSPLVILNLNQGMLAWYLEE